MNILGISAFYHDSAAAIICDGKIVAAAQEERFTRKKHTPDFPKYSIEYCLTEVGISINELDAVVFYDKPLLKFERLLETYYRFAPKGLASFIKSMPVWLKDKLFLEREIRKGLEQIESNVNKKIKILYPEHHLSHAASTFYVSPFESAAILTIDGVGEWATTSICFGSGNEIKVLKELHFPNSLGLLYSAFTYFLGFKVNSGEYKLMGLAPYGNNQSPQVQQFINTIKSKLVNIKEDGSIALDQKYFTYATGLRMVDDNLWESLFGFSRRTAETEFDQQHANLALALQIITEEVVIKMAKEAKRLTGSDNLCMAGGVALNCVANGKLQDTGIFKNIFITPASGDAGGALGAALAAHYIYFKQTRITDQSKMDSLQGSYLGPSVEESEIQKVLKKYKANAIKYLKVESLVCEVAKYIADGNIIGWVQGRMEFGPRALGARSILGDARNEEMQKKLNLKIKFRESFRPFAPSVLAEDVKEYFEFDGISPYMLLVHPVSEARQLTVPNDYPSFSIRDKLYYKRSDLPSITHVDYSARIQTVHKETNPIYYSLIDEFKKITGVGLIVNTSFNVRGEPIVCNAEDAYRCFMRTDMDYLVINEYIFSKSEQPIWLETDNWKEEFVLD